MLSDLGIIAGGINRGLVGDQHFNSSSDSNNEVRGAALFTVGVHIIVISRY